MGMAAPRPRTPHRTRCNTGGLCLTLTRPAAPQEKRLQYSWHLFFHHHFEKNKTYENTFVRTI